MAGRKPIPFQLIDDSKLRISKEKKELRKKIPNVSSNNISCPKHLCLEARKEWKRIVKLYKEMDMPLINNLDKNSLEIYCNTLILYHRASEEVLNDGIMYVNPTNGKMIQNPYLAVQKQATDILKKYGEMLLLDPLSRSRIGIANAKAKDLESEDPMAQLLNQNIRNL